MKKTPAPIYTLDLSDAILPENWPTNLPKQLKVKKGSNILNYDIIEEPEWAKTLRDFVEKNSRYLDVAKSRELPIGINHFNLPIGSIISDEDGNIIAQGKNKKTYLKQQQDKQEKHAQQISELQLIYPHIKEEFLIEFNDSVKLLLNEQTVRPLSNAHNIYDTFNDLLIAAGGSLYRDGSTASLGAYSSTIDYNALNTVFDLFQKEELSLLKDALEEVGSYSPLHSVMRGSLETYIEKAGSAKKKTSRPPK